MENGISTIRYMGMQFLYKLMGETCVDKYINYKNALITGSKSYIKCNAILHVYNEILNLFLSAMCHVQQYICFRGWNLNH